MIVAAKIGKHDIAHLWVKRPKVRLWRSFCGRLSFYSELADGGGPRCRRCLASPRGKRLAN